MYDVRTDNPDPTTCAKTATLARPQPIERPEPFTWRAHPARQRPAAATFAAGVIVAMAAACALAANAWWAALAVVLLVVPLKGFFFPSRFTIDRQGVTARYLLRTRRYVWSEIRRFCHDRHGVYLSTRSRPSRLDAYRGMHLLFGSSREEVLRRIRERLAAGGGSTCSG